jgi:hypothetical protein
VNELAQFERRSEVLSDFSTRELVDELSDRLERRGSLPSKLKKTYGCVICGKKYPTPEAVRTKIHLGSTKRPSTHDHPPLTGQEVWQNLGARGWLQALWQLDGPCITRSFLPGVELPIFIRIVPSYPCLTT